MTEREEVARLGPVIGFLATPLWRRIAHDHEHPVTLGGFTRLGLLAVPAALTGSTRALWAPPQMLGR